MSESMTTGYYFHNNFIYTAVLYVNQFIAGFSVLVGKYIRIGCMVHILHDERVALYRRNDHVTVIE